MLPILKENENKDDVYIETKKSRSIPLESLKMEGIFESFSD
jgi:hypothetical protein